MIQFSDLLQKLKLNHVSLLHCQRALFVYCPCEFQAALRFSSARVSHLQRLIVPFKQYKAVLTKGGSSKSLELELLPLYSVCDSVCAQLAAGPTVEVFSLSIVKLNEQPQKMVGTDG